MSKSLNDFECHKVNPFLAETAMHVKEKTVATRFIGGDSMKLLNEGTGDITPAYQIQYKAKYVDSQEFTKVFSNFLPEAIKLKSSSLKVFHYIWNQKKKDSDEIYFDLKMCQEFTGFKSQQSVYNGLAQLVENKFIAKTEKPYKYWINPTMFFNGNRLRIVQDYITAPKFKALPKGEDFE